MPTADWRGAYRRQLDELPDLAARARPVVALTSACVDGRVHLSDAPADLSEAAADAEGAALLDMLRVRVRAGVGGEVVHRWAGGPAWIERTFPVTRSWGGTGPHAVMALTAIGAPAVTALGDRSPHMLAVVPGDVPLAQGGRLVPAREAAPGGREGPEVFILEYTAGRPALDVTPSRSSRIILRFGDLGIEADPDFDALTVDPGLDAGAGLLAGFQCVPADRLDAEHRRTAARVAAWRRAGVGAIHMELAGFEAAQACRDVLAHARGSVTSVGMSESELRLYFGAGALGPLLVEVGEAYGLDRVCVHADHWAATATRGDPARERRALMAGCLLAAARAEAGRAVRPRTLPAGAALGAPPLDDAGPDRGGWSLVSVPSLYLPAPATTLGMGDTFAGGCLLVLGAADEGLTPTARAAGRPEPTAGPGRSLMATNGGEAP